jgi:hypothetical protein
VAVVVVEPIMLVAELWLQQAVALVVALAVALATMGKAVAVQQTMVAVLVVAVTIGHVEDQVAQDSLHLDFQPITQHLYLDLVEQQILFRVIRELYILLAEQER